MAADADSPPWPEGLIVGLVALAAALGVGARLRAVQAGVELSQPASGRVTTGITR